MIHHDIFIQETDEQMMHTILISTSNLSMDGTTSSETGECDVDVTPNRMETTLGLTDTGDGITWLQLSTLSETSDYSFHLTALSDNDTGSSRSCEVEITDDEGEADSKTVTVTQLVNPE